MKENILVVGDIHAKFYYLERIIHLYEVNQSIFSKVVFLGDYVDDWTAPPEASYNTLKSLVDFKLKYPDNVILCIGNHDLGYMSNGHFRGSGFSYQTLSLTKDLYATKINGEPIFQVAYALEFDQDPTAPQGETNFLFTHAGVTRQFFDKLRELTSAYDPSLKKHFNWQNCLFASNVASLLNTCFERDFTNPVDPFFQAIIQVGPARNGNSIPGPLWADKSEFSGNYLEAISQVVGHTPVESIIRYSHKSGCVYPANNLFCDTLSTWYDRSTGIEGNIGDCSLLQIILEKGEHPDFIVIPKEDWLTS